MSQFGPPKSLLRRAIRKAMLILLARLPVGRWLRMLPLFPRYYISLIMARTDHTGLHSGVYRSYAEAHADIPPSRLAGWDHEDSASLWLDNIAPVRPSTYMVFFWLSKLYGAGQQLVDLGGSIGLTYYGYRRFSQMPDGARWSVVEVSSLARQGRQVAAREQVTDLDFIDDLSAAPACDMLLSAGAMQFMESSVPGLLERMAAKPRYILLNKLPVTPDEGYWTLHNYGPAVTPMQVYNRAAFVGYFEQAGYRLKDSWDVEDLDCLIPFHPERFVRFFSGYLFERID